MLKIISLTQSTKADSMSITADSMDSVIKCDFMYPTYELLSVPVRIYPEEIDIFINQELKSKKQTITLVPTYNMISVGSKPSTYSGTLDLKISADFWTESTYEIEIKGSTSSSYPGELVFRGKLFATRQSDLQNYKINKPGQNGLYKI
jgi:hypothetical protein